jgi:bifunctional non-homologous end joining protein LigD
VQVNRAHLTGVSVTERITAGRRKIEISHPDRVLFPDAGITKLDLARYYARIAPLMVRHTRDRPLAMQSFPAGIEQPGFFVKNRPRYFAGWIATAKVPRRTGGSITQVLANNAATLIYLAGQNVITPHVWTSRADRLEQPDRIVFDLDPPPERRFSEVRATARVLGDLLRDLGMRPFVMTTGSRGVHVDVAIRRSASYDDVHAFARAVADRLVSERPNALTSEVRKQHRGNRIFVDVGRNAYGQHAVAAYAVRPRPGAPVATPLHWDELDDRRLAPDRWTIKSLPERVDDIGDPWQKVASSASSLRQAQRLLSDM